MQYQKEVSAETVRLMRILRLPEIALNNWRLKTPRQ